MVSVRIGIALLCVLSALLPPVPEDIGFKEIIFMGIFALVASWGILHREGPRSSAPEDQCIRYKVIGFYSVLLFSSVMIFFNPDLTPGSWLRGLIPFLGLSMFFTGRQLVRPEDARFVLIWLAVAATMNVAIGLKQATSMTLVDVRSAFALRGMLNYKMYDALCVAIPPALLSAGIMEAGRNRYLLYALGGGLLLGNLLGLMRSSVVVAVVVVLTFMALTRNHPKVRKNARAAMATILLLALGMIVMLQVTPTTVGRLLRPAQLVVKALQMRSQMDAIGGENYRIREYRTVFSYGYRSPFLGYGLGASYQIYREALGFVDMRYTHNIFSYMLFTCGAMGVIALGILLFQVLKIVVRVLRGIGTLSLTTADVALATALLGMILYVQFQSIYRSVSFFAMFGLILGTITGRLYVMWYQAGCPPAYPASPVKTR